MYLTRYGLQWLTATNQQIDAKYRAQNAHKFKGKWLDKTIPQNAYDINAGFVTNLNDGTKRPVAYLEYDTITVISDGRKQFKGRLESQDNVIVWGSDTKWYRNLPLNTHVKQSKGETAVRSSESHRHLQRSHAIRTLKWRVTSKEPHRRWKKRTTK